MESTKMARVVTALGSCSAGVVVALLATASPAGADPADPAVAPAPPGSAVTVQASGTDATALPPQGVPHLASPDALPPGSTLEPQDTDSPNVGYLKDLWQAVQNHEISGKEALVMGLAQRGMNTPYPSQAPGPNVPITPAGAPPAPAPVGDPPPPTP